MAGAFDWLDTLSAQAGQVFGKAVDAAGAVATAKIAAEQQRAVIPDQTPVLATSPVQTAGGLDTTRAVMIGGAVVVGVVMLALLLRKE